MWGAGSVARENKSIGERTRMYGGLVLGKITMVGVEERWRISASHSQSHMVT